MNYGKKNVERRSGELENNRSRIAKKIVFQTVKVAVIAALTLFVCAFCAGGIYVGKLISNTPDIADVNIAPQGYSTVILDRNGKEIERLYGAGANRRYISLDKIPKDLQHAFVAIEDERFYEHSGVDPRGILRAMVVGVLSGGDFSQGASTISQQLLKNNYFISWMSEHTLKARLDRKVQEQYLALQLEKMYSKDQILENYLNTINLGAGTLGVEAASERYFNKKAEDLTLSECVVIAGITKNPSLYNPIEHPDENATRRLLVLSNMLEQGYITESQYAKAVEDDVYSRIDVASSETTKLPTTYFTDALIEQLVADMMEQKGYTETEAWQKLYSGGLEIQSTLDSGIQKICDEEVNDPKNYDAQTTYSFFYRLTVQHADGEYETFSDQTMLEYYRRKNPAYTINFKSVKKAKAAVERYRKIVLKKDDTITEDGETLVFTPQPQVALTVMDQSSGSVVALVGGRGKKSASRTLNRATDITRQPGSAFKILSAFAPALDAGGKTLASVQDDSPYRYSDGTKVKNYDKRYRGYTTIREAIQDSVNIVTVKTLTEIGTGMGFEYTKDFGISTLESGDNTQALALGGITNGVKNLELTAAYAALADGGTYHKPKYYIRVLDNKGNVFLNAREEATRNVVKETTAWLLTDAMEDVMTKGTGKKANFQKKKAKISVAGKSGTTSKNRDAVFVGYTPYYTCGIWGGYDDNSPQKKHNYSKTIWKNVMGRMHKKLASRDFDRPPGIIEKRVCKKSGLSPLDEICDHDPRGSMIYTEYFATGTQPENSCDHHTGVTLCKDSKLPISEFCPKKKRKAGVYVVGGGGEDEEYSLSQEILSQTCNVHTQEWKEKKDREKEQKDEKKKAASSEDYAAEEGE